MCEKQKGDTHYYNEYTNSLAFFQIRLLLRSFPEELIPNYHAVFYVIYACRVKVFLIFFILILRSESVCIVILALPPRRKGASQIIS